MNHILSILDPKQHKNTQISNGYYLDKIIKQKPFSNQLEYDTVQVKHVAQYYFDCDYIMLLANRMPELKKKEIKFQILNQIIEFTTNYFNSSAIEQFDPEFYVAMHDYIGSYNDTKHDPESSFEDKIESINKAISRITKKTRSRLQDIKNYLQNPSGYYLDERQHVPLYQLVDFKKADFLWTLEPLKYSAYNVFTKVDQDYYSTCNPG